MVADVALPWVGGQEQTPRHPVGEEGQRGTPTLPLARAQVEKDALQEKDMGRFLKVYVDRRKLRWVNLNIDPTHRIYRIFVTK